MSWNKENNIFLMRGMASKGIYQCKSGSWEYSYNLNNCKELAVTAGGLRDHFTTFMKRYKSKIRREVQGSNFSKA